MTNPLEKLRSFALAHNEIEFAHLCTAALAGESWAVYRLKTAMFRMDWAMGNSSSNIITNARCLDVIRSTDTTRPDGAVARKFEI